MIDAVKITNNIFEFIVDPLVAILAFIAIFYFIITTIRFLLNGDGGKRGELIKQMLWSVVGMFIIFSVWTIFTFVERITESNYVGPEDMVYFEDFEIIG